MGRFERETVIIEDHFFTASRLVIFSQLITPISSVFFFSHVSSRSI